MPKEYTKDAEHIDAEIADIVDRIRRYRDYIDEFELCVKELKAELQTLLAARGQNWQDDAGYARLVSGSERTYYDTSALDALLIDDPLRYGWLKDYRLKSPIQPRVQVK